MTKKKKKRGQDLSRYRDELGFDLTTYDKGKGRYHIQCSQCAALVINSTPCHEVGCPNKKPPRPLD